MTAPVRCPAGVSESKERILVDLNAETLIVRNSTQATGINLRDPLIEQLVAYIESGGGTMRTFGQAKIGDEVVHSVWEGDSDTKKTVRKLLLVNEQDLPFEILAKEVTELGDSP